MMLKRGISWIEDCFTDTRLESVRNFLSSASMHEPGIALFTRTPQSAPYHAEGPFVQQHIERMLVVLFAIEEGKSLLDIEELASKKEWHTQIEGLEHVLREHAATMRAYCLLHDLLKPVVFTIDTVEYSKGARIGFPIVGQKVFKERRDEWKDLYQKYLQHFSVGQGLSGGKELSAAFYDEYELHVHYPHHGRLGGSSEYRESYERIGAWLRLRKQDIEMTQWLTRCHIDVITAFQKQPNTDHYEVFSGRAQKAGLDTHEAMELLLAATFLDVCMGSLFYEQGRFSVQFDLLFHFLTSERLIAPHRLQRRAQKAKDKQKRAFKQLLEQHRLIGSNVFALFEIPHGPERGVLMAEIRAYVRGESHQLSESYRSEELLFRLKQARATFDAHRRT